MIAIDGDDMDEADRTRETARILLFIAECVRLFLRGESGPPPFRPDSFDPEFVKAIAMAIEILEAGDARRKAGQKGRRAADIIPFADLPNRSAPDGDAARPS